MNNKMIEELDHYDSYFLSYSGARLPLKLVSALEAEEIENRNTCFGVCINAAEESSCLSQQHLLEKIVICAKNVTIVWCNILEMSSVLLENLRANYGICEFFIK